MGGDFSGKNQDCSKGIYALAGKRPLCIQLMTFLNIMRVCLNKTLLSSYIHSILDQLCVFRLVEKKCEFMVSHGKVYNKFKANLKSEAKRS